MDSDILLSYLKPFREWGKWGPMDLVTKEEMC